MNRTTLIFEHLGPGHFVTYAKVVAEVFAASGDRVVMVLNGKFKGSSCAKPVEELPEGVELHWTEPFEVSADPVASGLPASEKLAEFHADLKPARVCLPTGDHMMVTLGMSGKARKALEPMAPVMMITHNAKIANSPLDWKDGLKIGLHALCVRHCAKHRLMTVDPFASMDAGAARVKRRTLGMGMEYTPWLMHSHTYHGSVNDARTKFDLPQDAKILVAAGAMNNYRRKGYGELIASTPHWLTSDDRLLWFVGSGAHQALDPLLEKLPKDVRSRIRVEDAYYFGEDFGAVMKAGDAVWAANPFWRGISSIQLLASMQGKPAVVAQSHESGAWLANRIGPAAIAPLESPEKTAEAVLQALDMGPPSDDQLRLLQEMTSPEVAQRILAEGERFDVPDELKPLLGL